MTFTTPAFLVFFLLFFFLYWFVFSRRVSIQNAFILFSSYVFYAFWDWRFLGLLAGSSLLYFFIGIQLGRTQKKPVKRMLLWFAILQGIGLLLFFKYYNFFIESLSQLFHNISLSTISLVLPMGISFYTFKALGYLLDIDKGKTSSVYDPVVFLSYLSFFPTIMSGPIDKSKHLIPQLQQKRIFKYYLAVDGMRQVLWGLFKKIVIADNCISITQPIFDNYASLPASSLVIGAFLLTIQVYADFSGYSEMAIGFSKLLGFSITKNFDFPFFAQNIADFWRKWHISLTAWTTEYIFTPLTIAFRNIGKAGLILAIVINFVIIGFWHDANWTYVLFGLIHGCYFIPLILKGTMNKKKKIPPGIFFPGLRVFLNIIFTFFLVMLTFIVFGSSSVSVAIDYFKHLFSARLFSIPTAIDMGICLTVFFFIIVMFVAEWLQRDKDHALRIEHVSSAALRISIYYVLIFAILLYGSDTGNQFMYFKF